MQKNTVPIIFAALAAAGAAAGVQVAGGARNGDDATASARAEPSVSEASPRPARAPGAMSAAGVPLWLGSAGRAAASVTGALSIAGGDLPAANEVDIGSYLDADVMADPYIDGGAIDIDPISPQPTLEREELPSADDWLPDLGGGTDDAAAWWPRAVNRDR